MDLGIHAGEQPSRPPRSLEAHIGALEREVETLRAERERSRHYGAQLEAIIDGAPLAIYLKDAAHAYVMVNREYERLAARKRTEILGRNDFELFPEPVAQLFRSQDEEVAACVAPMEFKETVPLADGEHSFITSKFSVRSAAGELVGVAGVCTEITALERAQLRLEQTQAELVKQERLATLGELSAVIAHEVRNPLGAIFNSLAAIKHTLAPTPRCQQLLDIIGEEADRLNRMVSALLELAGPSAVNLAPTAAEAMAADAIEAAQALAEPTAEVCLLVPQPLPPALVDEKLLRQAVVNLIANAIQAPKRRGRVTVRVQAEGGLLRIDVIDDGLGVPPDLTERIFAPFFTTRAAGTGLGLAVVRRIAEAHRGTVAVEPTPGGGATFVLRVPLAVERCS